MCANAKLGANTFKPGDTTITHGLKGGSLQTWGIGNYYNARAESLKTVWKNYERVWIRLTQFYEARALFEIPEYKDFHVGCVSNGVDFNIITRPALGIVKDFHTRMPLILADPTMWLVHGVIIEMNPSQIKLAS